MRLWNSSILCTETHNGRRHDQIAFGVGSDGFEDRTCFLASLCFAVFQKRLYATATLFHSRPATVFPNRLSRDCPVSWRLAQLTTRSGSQTLAALHHAAEDAGPHAKKRALESLLDRIFRQAQRLGFLDDPVIASIDATGLETRYASRYFVFRQGDEPFERYRWTKLTAVCHHASHLIAAAVVTQGPSQDSPQFPEALEQAAHHLAIRELLADAGYDGEHNHRLAREQLGVAYTVIALNRRHSQGPPKTKYRRQMYRHFPRTRYGQRWQAESVFSRMKRRLGDALSARSVETQRQECVLRVLTHNLMILAWLLIIRFSTEQGSISILKKQKSSAGSFFS